MSQLEIPAHLYAAVATLVEQGKSVEEALSEAATKDVKKAKAPTPSTMPQTKIRLRDWLSELDTEVVEEHRFHPVRKWRFDWYLPEYKIAIEYEGFLAMGSNAAHSAVGNIMRDVEKYNAATSMGIRVFRAHAENIRTGAFFTLMDTVLEKTTTDSEDSA